MRSIAYVLMCGALTALAAAPSKPTFAGWVRKSTGSVSVKVGGAVTTYASANARGRRLFAGNQVRADKGAASLLVYGKELELKAARGWYTIPAEAKKAPAGRDVFAKYLLRAGRTRDAGLAEKLWLALAVAELSNPNPPAGYSVRLRIAPAKTQYRVGERIKIQIQNSGPDTVYVTLLNIDSEGNLAPMLEGEPIPSGGKWVELPSAFSLGLPSGWKEGTDVIKAIATSNPVDFGSFDTENTVRMDDEAGANEDPLAYLLRVLSEKANQPDPGKWTTAQVSFLIRR